MSDEELIPEILPLDARLAFQGPVAGLIDILSRATRVIPNKVVIEGTSEVLLEAKPQKAGTAEFLRATATDGSLTVSAVGADIDVRLPGSALIPGQKFLSILKMAPSEEVAVQIVGNTALIRSGRAQWKVQLVSGNSLPWTPNVEGLERVAMPRKEFLGALRAATVAASHILARASLMQVQVRAGAVTGTDGNRAHRSFFSQAHQDIDFSVPVSTAEEVIRLLDSSDEEHFSLGYGHSNMIFVVDRDYVVSSALITQFPDVDPLFIRASMLSKNSLTVDIHDLSKAVKRVRVNSDPDFSSIFLSITKLPDETWGLAVRAKDRLGNSAYEYLPASWDGPQEPRDFCVNHKGLLDLLDCLPGDEVCFQVGEDTQSVKSPLLVEADDSFTGLLVQMRSDYLT